MGLNGGFFAGGYVEDFYKHIAWGFSFHKIVQGKKQFNENSDNENLMTFWKQYDLRCVGIMFHELLREKIRWADSHGMIDPTLK